MKKKKLKSLSLNKFKIAQIDNTSMFKAGNGTDSENTACKTADVTLCKTEFIRICNGSNARQTYFCLTDLDC